MEIKAKQQESTTSPKETEGKSETVEDEVRPCMSLDELRTELKRSYREQQAARRKMQQQKSPKKQPECITKTAVNSRLASTRSASVSSAKRPELNGMPVSPADLKPANSLRPVGQERLKSNSQQVLENGTRPSEFLLSYPIHLHHLLFIYLSY